MILFTYKYNTQKNAEIIPAHKHHASVQNIHVHISTKTSSSTLPGKQGNKVGRVNANTFTLITSLHILILVSWFSQKSSGASSAPLRPHHKHPLHTSGRPRHTSRNSVRRRTVQTCRHSSHETVRVAQTGPAIGHLEHTPPRYKRDGPTEPAKKKGATRAHRSASPAPGIAP